MAPMASHGNGSIPSPYVELDRDDWARLREEHPMRLDAADVERLRGLGERLDLAEIEQVYLPVSRLLSFYERSTAGLHKMTSEFLDEGHERTPFVIGVAGSVAVGKSTTARILRELIARWDWEPKVDLVTTDGFLHPNAVLTRRNLMARKGFPESYDRRALLRFVAEVKAGKSEVTAPVYSHLTYDIVPGERIVVRRPDVLIVEGLNVLQPPQAHPTGRAGLAVSDFFDFSVYVDAHVGTSRPGTSSASWSCGARPSRTRSRTSTATPRWTTTRPWTSRRTSGTRSTPPTWSRTSPRPAAGPPSSC